MTLGEALPVEMARIRDEIMPVYQQCGPSAVFALMLMRRDLDAAAKAMIEGDTVEMIRVYEALKGYSL